MRSLVCKGGGVVDLSEHVTKSQPIAICARSTSETIQISLKMKVTGPFRALCAQSLLKKDDDAIPFYARCLKEIPESFFVVMQDENGFCAFFCLSHKGQVVRLISDAQEGLLLRIQRNGGVEVQEPALVCVRGDQLHQTIALAICFANKAAGDIGRLSDDKGVLPPWLDTLGWESGSSYGQRVTHDKVVNAIWGLRRLGIQPGYVMIDEGWQNVKPSCEGDRMAMASFEADPERFPYGLKGLVEELHRAGVHHVGIWHGAMGHRDGVHRSLAARYDLGQDLKGRYFLGGDLGRSFQFYNDFYQFLREQGISFVKVGDQNRVVGFCEREIDAIKLYRNLQSAIQAATSIQFDFPHLNGECLRNENLFYWNTSRLASAGESRGEDSLSGTRRGLRNVLVNALWLQHLMLPDFNAWMSDGRYAQAHGLLRALSGSINVISDLPGKHDEDLLRKMVLPSGKLLRADKPLTLCAESALMDPWEEPIIYKAYTRKGNKGVLALFNLLKKSRSIQGTISPADVEGLSGESFAVFSNHHGFIGVMGRKDQKDVVLKADQCDVITFSPILKGIGVIGAYNFFLAPGPITDVTIEDEAVHLSSIVSSPMIVYCERQVLEIRRNGEVIPWEYDKSKKVLTFDARENLAEIPVVYTINFE